MEITVGRVWIPRDGAVCNKCGRPLAFKQLASGRWCPVEPDGSDHFDLCRAAQRGSLNNPVRARALARADEKAFGVRHTKRKDFSLPDWDGVGVPW